MSELTAQQRADAERMREMLYGQLLSRALCVLAELRIPDQLADGPLPVSDLAGRVDADTPALRRLLRGLVVFEVVAEVDEDVFGLTSLGGTLRGAAPASAQPTALLLANEVGVAWAELADTVRTGRSAFEQAFGGNLFDYLERRPERREVFDRSQAEGLALELDEIIEHVDFAGRRVIVDVGGGDGAFLLRVLAGQPSATGVVFDLPGTTPLADRRIKEAGLADRCRTEAGDFFTSIPGDGDLTVLSHVLHDWDDEHAMRLLRTCERDMAPGTDLLVVDLLAAGRTRADAGYRAASLMDLYMLSLFGGTGGQERSASDLAKLVDAAGFHIDGVRRMPSGMGTIRATKTR